MAHFAHSIGGMDAPSVCVMLRQTGQIETIAGAMTHVAAVPCSPVGNSIRDQIAALGGLESIVAILLSSDDDIRLQCKAVNALGSLCNSQEVAKGFLRQPSSVDVLKKLGCMLRLDNVWAQADAVGCLSWLVGYGMPKPTLHELVPAATRLMTDQMIERDNSLIADQGRTDDRSRRRMGKRGATERRWIDEAKRRAEVVLERNDNLRVYSLIFLLKASQTDTSSMKLMLDNGILEHLVGYLSKSAVALPNKRSEEEQGSVTECCERIDNEQALDDEIPSLLLIARLLFRFSTERDCGTILLKAKCVPALLSFRRRLRESAGEPSTEASHLHWCSLDDRRELRPSQPCGHAPSESSSTEAGPCYGKDSSSAGDGGLRTLNANGSETGRDINGRVTPPACETHVLQQKRCEESLCEGGTEGRSCCGDHGGQTGPIAGMQELQEPGLDDLVTFIVERILNWGKGVS